MRYRLPDRCWSFFFPDAHLMILITTNADIGLTQHFHLHLLLFPAGPMYVRTNRLGGVRLIYVAVYCNSLLATLNVRNLIREKGHNDLGISLRQISDSNASTVDGHKVAGLVVAARPLDFSQLLNCLLM